MLEKRCEHVQKISNTFCFFNIFLPATVWAQLPDQTPEKFDKKVWGEYTKNQLLKLFPEDQDYIRNGLRINVTDDQRANAFSVWQIGYIEIFYGLIRDVETEDEYAYVIAHEYGHIQLQQPEPIVMSEDGIVYIDYNLQFIFERQADNIAFAATSRMGYDHCAGYTISKKVFMDDWANSIRLTSMLDKCKQSMPQIPGKASPK